MRVMNAKVVAKGHIQVTDSMNGETLGYFVRYGGKRRAFIDAVRPLSVEEQKIMKGLAKDCYKLKIHPLKNDTVDFLERLYGLEDPRP
jgi:hypothetical protein